MKFVTTIATAAGIAGTVFSAALPDMRVTNGTFVPQGDASYLVQLYRYAPEGVYACGATIVDEDTIVTAAHCVATPENAIIHPASSFKVRYGDVKRKRGTEINVLKVHSHPGYTSIPATRNDIAVLKVKKISLQKGVAEPIAVYDGDIKPHEKMKIYGWGLTRTNGASVDFPKSLLQQTAYIGEPNNCKILDKSYENANGPLICADNNYNIGVDVCQGDSGTGTTVIADGKAYYAGLVSYGTDAQGRVTCGEAGSFGMYTRISYYLKWIESIVGHKINFGPGNPPSKPTATDALPPPTKASSTSESSSSSSSSLPSLISSTSTSANENESKTPVPPTVELPPNPSPQPKPKPNCLFFFFCF